MGNHIIYTDGGCHNGPSDPLHGIGAWAFIEPTDLSNEYVDVYCGYVSDTTNNRTEMIAVIEGILHDRNDPAPFVHVISDSGYIVKGYTDPAYLDKWIMNNWRTSNKAPVMNKDLWEKILDISHNKRFTLEAIRGHKKDKNHIHAFWNDICDKACTYIMENCTVENIKYHLRYDLNSKKFITVSIISILSVEDASI